MSTSQEAILADRAAGGDAMAFAQLVDAALPRMRAAVGPLIPDQWRSLVSAEDVAQAAATDALIALSTFHWRGEGSFAAWFVVLGRNNLRNAVRALEAEKRGGHRRRIESGTRGTAHHESCGRFLDELVALGGAGPATPSGAVALDEAIATLSREIDELPEPYRDVVRLYDIEGGSAESVASALGRSVGAMFMLRARAHGALADRMGSVSRYLSRS